MKFRSDIEDTKIIRNIPYSRQNINEHDIQAVVEVLHSNFITQGPMVNKFEDSVKRFCGAKHAVAVSSGTSALHLSLMALGVGEGDVVWTSPISFVASANSALYTGASVDFVDVDPLTANMDIDALAQKLEIAEQSDKLPKAVVIVHFSGRACDMERVSELSAIYGFSVIEDSAHALGGSYSNGQKIGNSVYSDATIFSFHPVKSIATGEGGMIVTNRQDIAEKAKMLSTHGITRNPELMQNESEGSWYYEQTSLGFNYRITDIQSALGVSQMLRLPNFIEQRQKLAERYDELLQDLPLITPPQDHNSAWHIYVIQLLESNQKISRRELFDKMRAEGIGVNVHYIPIHTQPYYKDLGFQSADFPCAVDFYKNALTIPLFPEMTEDEQDFVVSKLSEFLS